MMSVASEPPKATELSNDADNKLVLVNLSANPCAVWLNAARDAGQPWHSEVVDNLSEAKLLLQKHHHFHALICYEAPKDQIARCLAKQRLPSQALANWLNTTETLLEFYREHYQRLTLVCRTALVPQTKALLDQLATRSGIALGRLSVVEEEKAIEKELDPQTSAMYRLLAMQALHFPRACRVAQELEASSLPLEEPEYLLDLLDDSYEKIQKSLNSKAKAFQFELKEVREENELLIDQLHKNQEELEKYLFGHKGSNAKLSKLESEIKRKNDKLYSFSRKNERLSEELKDLKQSKSWKVTAPLRNVMKILGGQKGGD